MKGYIYKVLLKYGHTKPIQPQLTQHKHRENKYGAKQQLIPAYDIVPTLDIAVIKMIQAIIGALLYYSRAVGNKRLVSLSTIVAQQASATEDTADTIKQILDYVVTYQNDGIIYCVVSIVFAAQSDTGFHN